MAEAGIAGRRDMFDRPVFIVAAPRSGSTLLFETLAHCSALWTVGGEAHELFEGIPHLRVGAPGIDSNRLTAANADTMISNVVPARLAAALRDHAGRAYSSASPARIRLLEKTPKNSLRIPFLAQIFPDALFIYLYRDGRENISSIMEAWRSGGWITYRNLPGWEGPWSLLLPPGWADMRGRSLAEVAAFQWQSANDYILDDLAVVPASRWTSIDYAGLVADPAGEVRRLCRFAGVPFDRQLAEATDGALPLSRYTHTPPARDKWKKNADAIATVSSIIDATGERIQQAVMQRPASQVSGRQADVPAKIGRNEPCPCGSGKKYKRCHGAVG